ncbi:MAG TPA: DUF2231 domain-containing protein [Actinomycetes bacterium]|nr:DUF2231 domain-containing protein [Actinomycetes bacterium]
MPRKAYPMVLARPAIGWLNVRMPETLGGIPLHPLVVHAVVVLLPLAAIGVIAIALVPKWRTRFGVLVVAAAAVTLGFVPIATSTGEQLQETTPASSQLDDHVEFGEGVIFWAVPLLVLSIALWWFGRRAQAGSPVPRWLNMLVTIAAVVVSLGATVLIVLVGHSGAGAVWGT